MRVEREDNKQVVAGAGMGQVWVTVLPPVSEGHGRFPVQAGRSKMAWEMVAMGKLYREGERRAQVQAIVSGKRGERGRR